MPRSAAAAYSSQRAANVAGSSEPAPVSQSSSAETVSGYIRARLSAMLPPMLSPHTAAGAAPRVSIRARASSTDWAWE